MPVPSGYSMVPAQFLWKQADQSGPYILDANGNPILYGTGNIASGGTDSGNPVKVAGVYNSTLPTFTTGQRGDLQVGSRGALLVQIMSPDTTTSPSSGTNSSDALTASAVGLVGRSFGYNFNGSTWDRLRGDTNGVYTVSKPVTSGGLTAGRVLTGTTGVIKASAGQLYQLRAMNTNAAARYLHLYNKATGPTLSTDTPIFTVPLQAASVPAEVNWGNIGLVFSTGIAWAYTTDDIAIPATAATSTELHFSCGYA